MLVPPFGSDAPKMKTIFDFKHFKDDAYFLDTQRTYTDRCVQLINVRKGKEEKVGRSWKVHSKY